MHVSGLSAKEVKFPYLGDHSKQHRKVRRGGISTWERDTNFHQKKKQKNKRFYYAICANESRPRRGYLCTHGNYCTSIGDSALPSAATKKLSFLEKEEEEAAAAAAPTLQSLLSQRESLVGVPMADQQDENGSFVVEVGPKKRENLRHCTFSHSSHGTGRPVVL